MYGSNAKSKIIFICLGKLKTERVDVDADSDIDTPWTHKFKKKKKKYDLLISIHLFFLRSLKCSQFVALILGS